MLCSPPRQQWAQRRGVNKGLRLRATVLIAWFVNNFIVPEAEYRYAFSLYATSRHCQSPCMSLYCTFKPLYCGQLAYAGGS